MFLLGFSVLYLVCVQVDLDEQKVLQFIDQKVAVSGVVSQDIIKKNGTYRITISNVSFNYSKNTLKSQVYAMLSDVPEDISRSDIVVLEGILKSGFGDYIGFLYRPKIVSCGKPSPPDYAEQARSTFSIEEDLLSSFGFCVSFSLLWPLQPVKSKHKTNK